MTPEEVEKLLRDYQRALICEARKAIAAGHRRILLCLATGGGKSLTAAAIIHGCIRKSKRALVCAHRKELIDQLVATLFRLGVHPVGVLRGSDRRKDLSRQVQVASIQTLARRPRMDPPPDLIFIDEAHRALAKGYQEYLYDAYPKAIIIGLTATPCRVDGKPLRDGFEVLVQGPPYSKLIAGGYIDAPLVYGTPLGPNLAGVSTKGGDYNVDELEEAVNKSALIGNLGAEWQKRSGGRRTVVFCVSVKHSLAVLEMFLGMGVKAEHLDGTTPEGQRAAILRRLESGETQLVTNVGVLCEGWDCPPVKCLVVARPTKSLALWMQMAGRILRPWEGVQPIILDHGGNVDRHKLPHIDRTWTLEPTKKKRAFEDDIPMRICGRCFAYVMAGTKTCPHCAAERPEHVAEQRSFEPVPVDLALRTIEGEAIAEGAIKKRFFMATYKTARDRGWLFGAVLHRFRERFEEEAPTEWVDALKSDFSNDAEWKERVKEKRAARKALEAAALGPDLEKAS